MGKDAAAGAAVLRKLLDGATHHSSGTLNELKFAVKVVLHFRKIRKKKSI